VSKKKMNQEMEKCMKRDKTVSTVD
jgi:hypothetical protein